MFNNLATLILCWAIAPSISFHPDSAGRMMRVGRFHGVRRTAAALTFGGRKITTPVPGRTAGGTGGTAAPFPAAAHLLHLVPRAVRPVGMGAFGPPSSTTSTSLASAVVRDPSAEAPAAPKGGGGGSSSPSGSGPSGDGDGDGGAVHSTGTLIGYSSSRSGGGGAVASVLISDELVNRSLGPSSSTTTGDPASDGGVDGGDGDKNGRPASMSETLFAGLDLPPVSGATTASGGVDDSSVTTKTAKTATAAGSSREGDDLLGRSVTFRLVGDGVVEAEGIVIAQRYPVAFVLLPPSSSLDEEMDAKLARASSDAEAARGEGARGGEGRGNDLDDSNKGVQICVNKSTKKILPNGSWDRGGLTVDCFGNVLSSAVGDSRDDEITSTTTDQRDGEEDDDDDHGRPIFAPIPRVGDIALIDSPLLTGVTMIDSLAPIGRGQNMLFVGEEGTGKRDLVTDAVVSQVRLSRREGDKGGGGGGGARCVYAVTSSDPAVRRGVERRLRDAGVLDSVTVVSARGAMDGERAGGGGGGDDSDDGTNVVEAAEAIAVAAAACSVAEYYALRRGEDCLVIVDDLDQHRAFWDHTTRVLADVYGMDAVVADDASGGASSEMRAFYSSLVQRAGRYNDRLGGGSLTLALLVDLLPQRSASSTESTLEEGEEEHVYTAADFDGFNPKVRERIALLTKQGIRVTTGVLDKLKIPIPPTRATVEETLRVGGLRYVDDLISMSDGQIWLDKGAYLDGRRPAIDAQRSITRVGVGADTASRADAPALRDLVGGLRFEFAQADAFEEGLADGDPAAQRQLLRRDAWLLAMHRDGGDDVRTLSEECICLLAARGGYLDDVVVRRRRQSGVAPGEGGEEAKDDGEAYDMRELLSHVKRLVPGVVEEIDETFELSRSNREQLEEGIKSFFS